VEAAARSSLLQVEAPPQRKNSSDALRSAVQQSKAVIKKGLKTGLSGLRKSPAQGADVGTAPQDKVARTSKRVFGSRVLWRQIRIFIYFLNLWRCGALSFFCDINKQIKHREHLP
jgi:hypothetical protein